MKVDLIILAGGKSSRMGYDKQKIVIQGKSLLGHLLAVGKAYFDQVILVKNDQEGDLGVLITSDQYPDAGPLAGLHAGLKVASAPYAYVIGVDMPVFSVTHYQRLLKEVKEGAPGVIVRDGPYLEPFHGLYHKNLVEDLEACLRRGETSLQAFLKKAGFLYIDRQEVDRYIDFEWLFQNLNTPKDLLAFEKGQKI